MTQEEIFEKYKDDPLLSSLLKTEEQVLTDEELKNVEKNGNEALEQIEKSIERDNKIQVTPENARYTGAKWFKEIQNITASIIGVGGIGSWTALLINRLSVELLKIYDFDDVEEANMSGQLYRHNDIGKHKVDAIADTLQEYGLEQVAIMSHNNVCSDFITSDVVICGLDNMQARKNYFSLFKKDSMARFNDVLFIDGRLSPEVLQIFAFTNKDIDAIKEYEEKYLFDSSEAVREVCSYKQTSNMAAMIGSLITNIVVNWIVNKVEGLPIATVPFLTSYNSKYMKMDIFNNFKDIK